MNLLLIQRFQAIGAAIASVAAETIIAIVQIIIVRNELNPLEILKSGIHYYVAGGIMAFALYFIEKSMAVSIWNTLFMVLVGSIIYGLALLLMRDEFLINLIKQEITKLRDKKIRR
jgi:peptidoglycan biosynthesis protein MviN/MurJ (putative lipid II flippase)